MSDPSDRDRVTAILTLAEAAAAAVKDLDHQDASQTLAKFYGAAHADVPWLARTLLEALDTIDRLEGENEVTKNLLTDVVNPDNDEPALGRAMSAAEDWLWKDLT